LASKFNDKVTPARETSKHDDRNIKLDLVPKVIKVKTTRAYVDQDVI
jgi:hypothetical protein